MSFGRIEAESGDSEARRAAENGEQHTLGQQLAEHAGSAGAQRGAHRQFLVPGLRARQLEVRDVGGGNEQHKGDGAQQQPERAAHFPRAEHFAQVAALELVLATGLSLA